MSIKKQRLRIKPAKNEDISPVTSIKPLIKDDNVDKEDINEETFADGDLGGDTEVDAEMEAGVDAEMEADMEGDMDGYEDDDIYADVDVDLEGDIYLDDDLYLDGDVDIIFDASTENEDTPIFLQDTKNNKVSLRSYEDTNFSDNIFFNSVISIPKYTSKYLTRFEKIRAISERACMLSNGAPSTLPDKDIPCIQLAELELAQKKMPFIIQRKLPNGITENISINNLIILP